MDSEDLELLKLIAQGTTDFRPVQDEPSDSPRWLRQVERLRGLKSRGLIRMPDAEQQAGKPGHSAAVGPCELTPQGKEALQKREG